jgi:hypothetical protein
MIWFSKGSAERILRKIFGYSSITEGMKDLRNMERDMVVSPSIKEMKCSKDRERFAKYKTLRKVLGTYMGSLRSRLWGLLTR